MKKLIPALALLLVSAVMLATSSFAWFSMNTSVTVTGMSVTTKVNSNLFVHASTAGTDKAADSAFGSYADQIVTGTLQPSSTVDGVSFFYTTTADALGRKESGNYTAVVGDTIPSNYKAYVDYVVELKAVNTESHAQYININQLNLTYNNAAITTEKAYRVAIFVQAQSGENAYAAMGAAADKIYSLEGATYFTNGKAVDSATTLETVANLNSKLNTMTVAAGATTYYKVTVRLWLEGEDNTCNNTVFKTLDKAWRLQLGFSIDDDNTPAVANINTAAPAQTYGLTQTLSNVTSNVGEATVIANYAFTAKYTAGAGYTLPENVTVSVGGNALTADTDYTWSQATGVLTINSTAITGAVAITVTGAAE